MAGQAKLTQGEEFRNIMRDITKLGWLYIDT
jgi:hypothetical protein